MRLVLDASAILEGEPDPEGVYLTVPGIVEELRSTEGRFALERLDIEVREPGPSALARVRQAAEDTGDIHRLSSVDLAIIALSLELEATLVSNDFSIQNTCRVLGVRYLSPRDEIAKVFRWELRCRDCGKRLAEPGTCPVCGGEVRIRRRKEHQRSRSTS